MNKITLIFTSIFVFTGYSYSQTKQEIFGSHGKPIMLIYTNFNSLISGEKGNMTFENTRAYLGYEHIFSKEFSGEIVFDVGDPGTGKYQLVAFLKNGYLNYKKNNLSVSFGMISTTQFKIQEKLWGYRYIEKSFQDAYGFNSSADLGVNFDYKISRFLSADFSVINGEGYKKIQADSILRPGFGFTLTPMKGLIARIFMDFMKKESTQQSLSTFIGYTNERWTFGGEYNYQKNQGMINSRNWFGSSFYGTWKPSEKIKLFIRYDNLASDKIHGASSAWNIHKDGQLFITGLEFSPVKGIKLAPNYRRWNPDDDLKKNATYFYLNCEVRF